jgi:chloride channel 7
MDIALGEEAYLMTGFRHRSINQDMQKFESLDYDIYEDSFHEKEFRDRSAREEKLSTILVWAWTFSIGIVVALAAFFVITTLNLLTDLKLTIVMNLIESNQFWIPLAALLGSSVFLALVAVCLIVLIEPLAAGSGVPDIIAFLNGIKLPKIARVKTLLVKMFSSVLCVSSGLAVGPEGPIVQLGGIIGAGMPQGKSTTFGMESGLLKRFRNDHDKMDFVACGAAAGLAAAFGSPVGGTLFVLEEGASFWDPPLVWRIFFCAMTATFTFNFFLTGLRTGNWGQGFNSPGMLAFGSFQNQNTQPWGLGTLPIFVFIAACCGVFGGLFNRLNQNLLMPLRKQYITKFPWRRVAEVVFFVSAGTCGFWALAYSYHNCLPIPTTDDLSMYKQFYCPAGYFNDFATMAYNTQEASTNFIFHFMGPMPVGTLALFFCVYFLYYALSVGLALPGGTLVPSMLSGCAFGRLVAELLSQYTVYRIDPGTAALIGAASMLCGITRMTLSLAAIILESTNDMTYALPLIVSLVTAKLVGSLVSEGFYEVVLDFRKFPYLHWEPPYAFLQLRAIDVMNSAVVCLNCQETVARVEQILRGNNHNAFPVVHQQAGGRYLSGIVSRGVLIFLLRNKMFGDLARQMTYNVTVADFQELYPRVPPISSVSLTDEDRARPLDLCLYMNRYPYTLDQGASLSRVFRLFRMMGLRDIVVVNKVNSVVGIITRKDLTNLEWVVPQEDEQNEPVGGGPAAAADAAVATGAQEQEPIERQEETAPLLPPR